MMHKKDMIFLSILIACSESVVLFYFCSAKSPRSFLCMMISYAILLLLFLLGISVGANESIVNNLTTLGGQALLIASAGTLGSVLAAWGVYHFFFKERRRE